MHRAPRNSVFVLSLSSRQSGSRTLFYRNLCFMDGLVLVQGTRASELCSGSVAICTVSAGFSPLYGSFGHFPSRFAKQGGDRAVLRQWPELSRKVGRLFLMATLQTVKD